MNTNRENGFPSVAEVDRIVAIPDAARRNLLITESYYALSRAMRSWLGKPADTNWCTLAVWASKQAGQTIRQEDLRQLFERHLGRSTHIAERLDQLVETLLRRTWRQNAAGIRRILRDALHPKLALEHASAAVALGNLEVFAEIGREFARFLTELAGVTEPAPEKLEKLLAELRPGEPPAGQGQLRTALRSLYEARFEPDPKRRAELILLANLSIGFHEQTRLQPEIAAALEAPVPDARELRRRLLAELFPRLGLLCPIVAVYLAVTTPWDRLLGRLTEEIRELVRHTVTELLLNLTLPGEVLCLNEDLRAKFPVDLTHLTLPDLLALLPRIDPTPDSPRQSGAVDWADFGERMHYIADFFRAYQQDPRLYQPPFDATQVTLLRRSEEIGPNVTS